MTERVTVTRPRARAPRRPAGEQVGAAQVRALVRAQARLALATCSIVVLLLTGLPLLLAWAPGLSRIRLFGIRLPWLILCGGVPVVWVAVARRHIRLAERTERAFTEAVRPGRPSSAPPPVDGGRRGSGRPGQAGPGGCTGRWPHT